MKPGTVSSSMYTSKSQLSATIRDEGTHDYSVLPPGHVPLKIRANISWVETRRHNLVPVPPCQLARHNNVTLRPRRQIRTLGVFRFYAQIYSSYTTPIRCTLSAQDHPQWHQSQGQL